MKIDSFIEKCSINTLHYTVFKSMNYFKNYIMLKSVKIVLLKFFIETNSMDIIIRYKHIFYGHT